MSSAPQKWGFLGCGNLAQAIINGALQQKILKPTQILISNRTVEKSRKFSRATGVRAVFKNHELITQSDVIVIGTKPQDIAPVLEELSRHLIDQKIIVSLAAGVSSAILKKYLSEARTVARVMGNTPVTVQKGLFGISFGKGNSKDRATLEKFFSQLGQTTIVRDDKGINAITSGSASGAGFVLKFMEEFETWFKKKGFSPSQARQIAVETFLGAAELAKAKKNLPLKQLREAITSKKGTTLAGLNALKNAKVPRGLSSALDAAYQRAVEISKSLLKNQK